MCGIAGVLGLDPRASPNAVANALAASLLHRGPDDVGAVHDRGTLLVHRRLAIVDLSVAGAQPMKSACGRFTMVFNGEIYNHRELRARYLGSHRFRGSSDSETLLELFALKGPDSFAELNGIFAIALWDSENRSLTLARDGAGVKPLYCWEGHGTFAFASEIKALRLVPGFESPLDSIAAAAHVTYLWSPGDRTMFDRVKRFPAGCWRRYAVDGRSLTEGRFYSLPPYVPQGLTAEQAVRGTSKRLEEAVERQMLADVEVGAFLSGGLDSSSIVHFAKALAPGRMNCFTLGYDPSADSMGEMVADLPYARRAADHLGVELHEIQVDAGMADDLAVLVEMLDEPQADPAALGNFYIARGARERGIKVLLGGAGGDDIFTGYRRHEQFSHDRWIGGVPSWLRALLPRLLDRAGNGERARKLRKAALAMQGDADRRLLSAFDWLPIMSSASLLAAPVDIREVSAPLVSTLAATREYPAVERLLRLDQAFFLRDHNLNYTDKTGMAASVEIRVPFLDPDLMAWAATVPTKFKIRNGRTKWVLRKAMEAHLPREIIYRPKTGFGVPLRSWMRGPLRDLVESLTDSATLKHRNLFDSRRVMALRDDHYAGRVDAAYPLLAIVMIELWCRRFVDMPEITPALDVSLLPRVAGVGVDHGPAMPG